MLIFRNLYYTVVFLDCDTYQERGNYFSTGEIRAGFVKKKKKKKTGKGIKKKYVKLFSYIQKKNIPTRSAAIGALFERLKHDK